MESTYSSFDGKPDEIILHIASFLPVKDLIFFGRS